MRRRGIHYDIGTATLDGPSTRPTLTRDDLVRDLGAIASDLHANAVRLTGGDVDRLARAAEIAVSVGLEPWLSPMLPNATASETLAAISASAGIAEGLRSAGRSSVLVVGCELSTFMAGILPGDTAVERLAILSDLPRLMAAVGASGRDPRELFGAFLHEAVATSRAAFRGRVTYAAGAWETVDWTLFDLVGVDAYRDAANRATYAASLRDLERHGLPVAVTEFGCATYRGAADRGSLAWMAVDRSAEPRRLAPGTVRDEAAQAAEVGALLDTATAAGVDAAFVYTYVAPSYPASEDPALDLDAASYALVRSWPDGRITRKAAFDAVAARYGRLAANDAMPIPSVS